jgi:hypothetical protein
MNFKEIEMINLLCEYFMIFVIKGMELPNKYPDLIKSAFKNLKWTELLIKIFTSLNPFSSSSSSSSKQLPSFLSFLLSVPPSEHTANIVRLSAITLEKLLGKETPDDIKNYLKLTDFD